MLLLSSDFVRLDVITGLCRVQVTVSPFPLLDCVRLDAITGLRQG